MIFNEKQAVARIADRTASQHLWGHRTSSVTCHLIRLQRFTLGLPFTKSFRETYHPGKWPPGKRLSGKKPSGKVTIRETTVYFWYLIRHFLLLVLWNQASISNGFRGKFLCNVECNTMVDMTLIRPLNKGWGHSFWYQSISHVRLPIQAVNSRFFSRTHRLATIRSVQTDDRHLATDDRTRYGWLKKIVKIREFNEFENWCYEYSNCAYEVQALTAAQQAIYLAAWGVAW